MNFKDLARTGARTLVGGVVVLAIASSASARVKWRTGDEGPIAKMTPEQMTGVLTEAAAQNRGEPARKRIVVTLDRPITDDERAALDASGLHLLNYVGDNSFFASVEAARLNANGVAERGLVRNVRAVQRNWKMHPDLARGVIQPWSIVGGEGKPEQAAANPTVAAYILFHADLEFDEGLGLLAKHNAAVVSPLEMVNGAVIELPVDRIKALTDEDGVMWIEPPLPKFEELNFENRAITGANTAQAAPYSLTGAGVTVLVYDGGTILTTHQDFQGRAQNIDAASQSDHATHVSGTIGGAGVADPTEKGMAPGVLIRNAGFQSDGSSDFLYQDPGDMVADYTLAINTHGADIANNSIGNNTEPNGFDCSWQGDYGIVDTVIDSMVRGSINGQPFRIVWAAGNERQGSRCDVEGFGDYYSSGPPANAKNQISVGALNANNDTMTSFSSWGPSDDGRLRPDISAPGCESGGDGGVRSCSSGGVSSYSVKCGTSMASPTVCGLSALLIQDFRAQYPSEPDPRNSTLKAFWMHTAVDIINPGPDYQTGYGSVRVVPAIDFMRSGNFFEASVAQSGVYTATVVVQAGDPQLKVTIAWDDPAGTPNVNPTLVNDLDLLVIGPGGQYFPWTLNPANPAANAVQTTRNFRDNNEQVLINNPLPGAYLIEVRGFNVPQGPQTFSLCASPFLVNCSSTGTASLNSTGYNCSSLASLRVVDCDLNTSDLTIETVTVNLASTTNPAGLSVLLTEVAPEAATFTGTVQLSTSPGGGNLQVANADIVTLTYQDADAGSGSPATVTRTATVDCAGPVITNVQAINIAPRSATITFTTSEPASGATNYGLSCGALGSSASGASTTSHSINLTGLSDNTSYFFNVQGTDAAGNSTTNNNSGACFTFTTPEVPDFFTEIFDTSAHDLDNRSILFTPNGTFEGYDVCEFDITALPTDPATGTLVSLPDDSPSTSLTVTGGQSVKLYGVAYTQVWLNCNGNLTFTASDTDFTETLAEHFNKPRVSILYDDLNNAQGGQVRWAQLADRFVVTYVNVPQYNTGDQNTFQYELYFDGRIQLSWLACGSADNLVGLSRGTGLPVDFFESDLSTYGGCGPNPPVASDRLASTPLGAPVSIPLVAMDEGQPIPPGALTYSITSLPADGWLTDPGAAQITSVPYTLAGGGSVVIYEPVCTFVGDDTFQFKASDSGTPPEGGDSNLATVTVSVVGATQVFAAFDMTSSPHFALDAGWSYGVPTGGGGQPGGGSGSPDPTGGHTGASVIGFNLAGNYTGALPMRTATSTSVDCTGRVGVRVSFWRWLGVEDATYDSASFQVSTNGFSWTTVWAHNGLSMDPIEGWSLQSYDISAIADGQPNVQVRWTLGPTDATTNYCGWNIDDVEFGSSILPPPCPNDYDGDCEVGFSDVSFILANWPTYSFNDISLVLGGWGASCN